MTTHTMHFHAGLSSNRKTGHMLVTTSSDNTCPPSCAQKDICYAKFSFLGIHWRKVSDGSRSMGFGKILEMVRRLSQGTIWRYNQAGDLPGIGEEIDRELLEQLVDANIGKRGFTYTHKYKLLSNWKYISKANARGFTINVSADSVESAVKLAKLGFPTVVTVPEGTHATTTTIDGVKLVPCPADYESIQCTTCKMCAIPDRKTVLVFRAHGSKRKAWK